MFLIALLGEIENQKCNLRVLSQMPIVTCFFFLFYRLCPGKMKKKESALEFKIMGE